MPTIKPDSVPGNNSVATFDKEILRPGTYYPRQADGSRIRVDVTPESLERWASTFSAMRREGIKIPAPWRHDKDANPALDIKESSNNAGYWDKVWINAEDNALWGTLNSENPDNVAKIGTDVKEVSLWATPYVDGDGKDWGHAMRHVALVTHPIMKDQQNFKRVDDLSTVSLALSLGELEFAEEFPAKKPTKKKAPPKAGEQETDDEPTDDLADADNDGDGQVTLDADGHDEVGGGEGAADEEGTVPDGEPVVEPVDGTSIADCITTLKNGLDIVLPSDTNAQNFVSRLTIAVNQMVALKNKDNLAPQREEQPEVIMSDTAQYSKGVQIFARNQVKNQYMGRIKALQQTGRVNKKLIDEKLVPMLADLQFSIDDETGDVVGTGALDAVLDILESQPDSAGLIPSGKQPTKKGEKKAAGKAGSLAFSLGDDLTEEQPGEEIVTDAPMTAEERIALAKQLNDERKR